MVLYISGSSSEMKTRVLVVGIVVSILTLLSSLDFLSIRLFTVKINVRISGFENYEGYQMNCLFD